MPAKDTEKLEHELSKAKTIDDYLDLNQDNLQNFTLKDYLTYLLQKKSLLKADVIKASGLEQHYAYHIFSGKKHPSRPKVLALALALRLTPEETQYLLYYAGAERLYVRNPWDSVLWHALEHHLSVVDTNLLLESLAQKPFLC